jgi:putative restriction endonuclease
MEKTFTVEQMKSALLAVRDKVTEPQMSMLRAHYLYRTLSMRRIATFGGYDNYGAANLQYGALCGRIARELGFVSPGDQTYTVATVSPESDSKGEAQWRMDDVVVKALENIGWFKEVAGEKPEPEPNESGESPEVERDAVIKARRGQGKFRIDVIALWGGCAVTGCSLAKVLVASHIVPWAECSTDKEKLDPFNGLLLTPNLDKLVDRCLLDCIQR